ncbi:leucine-rich repeat and immunoglobulin-like domain-containing nogo receptor-interacting protein 4 isoform X2 [Dreissena polymorpha]|uniref:Uncharacterized protein n=2 Tax=Dreissena polymorpha TaxID=45954 RepID=A0A9D4BTN5_DREPO|nr:leucine-rich repeat and immunoglobulin-like domain-containing nogo receptor-interacting protein 4 isoform X2 [Dreissena polymorpha]KAH3708137.1 hypothetical protein DPMN_067576 [Dreissena polymorpha]
MTKIAITLTVISLITGSSVFVVGTYFMDPCPAPCRCLKFGGLQSVYCNQTGVRAVPEGIPANTQLLDLSFNSISHIRVGDLAYLGNLQQLYLSQNELTETSLDERALDLPSLVTIDLSSNNFKTIPTFLPRGLQTLWFLNNQIEVLRTGAFERYSSILYLDVSNNGMMAIQPEAFAPLTSLQTLYISFNNLTDTSFPPNLFAKNTNLTHLSLRFNQLTSLLLNLPVSLEYLDYVGNAIRTLPAYGFTSLPSLKAMEFWQGQITSIEDFAFYGLPNVEILDFMQCQISSALTKNTFAGLSGLTTIYLDINQISQIQPGAFHPLTSLTNLWMSGNNLTTLEPEVLDAKDVANLSTLYIDFNPWECDCQLRWLREGMDNATYVIQDPHLIKCASPPKLAGKSWDELKPGDFVC